MNTFTTTMNINRKELMAELDQLYSQKSIKLNQYVYLRKKYLWMLTISAAYLLKRILDIMISLMMLILLGPLFFTVAFLIKITDNGPIFYVATRVGEWGKEFPFPKFRSMKTNADKLKDTLLKDNDHQNGVTFKMKKDPRVTWIGRIIRKLSIDELPQLWCVFKGEMSLVGPRPPLPREVALYSLSDRRRLHAIPGLTCIWQVSGRGDIPFPQQVEMDLNYIQSQSLIVDIKLLLMTIPAVLIGKGAY